jgi:hypothetical protein
MKGLASVVTGKRPWPAGHGGFGRSPFASRLGPWWRRPGASGNTADLGSPVPGNPDACKVGGASNVHLN